MKTHINGFRFKYEVTSTPWHSRCLFSIKAIHKSSRRSSTINNVNQILSDFNISETDKNFVESDWELSKKKATYFVKKAKELFSDRNYLKFLEKRLDEDRAEGEWENVEP